MDNHADTNFFGSNIQPISFTSEEFKIAPFLADYSKHVNIPIHTGMTSYTMESGGVVIPIIDQGLWFRNRMKRILINPNQCQYFGIPICDNPTNQHMPLGSEADFNTHT